MKKTGNRLLALVLTLLLFVTVLPAGALAAPEDFTFTISDGGATITGYTGGGGYVSIPSQVKSGDAWYPVVAIGDNAFQGNSSISGLYIPCATVGTYAFFQCGGLTSVTFEASVGQIRGYAFAQCPNLTNITFLHSSSAFVGIEPYAFQLTGALTKTTVTVSSATNVNPYVKGYDWAGSMRNVEFGGMAPSITLQPVSKTCEEGSAVTFEVKATGYNPQYQWYYRTSPTGAWLKCDAAPSTSSTYTYSPTLEKSGYQYYVEVRNDYGAIASNVATLTVVKPTASPVITRQPQNVTVNAGSHAIFEVEATGSGTLKYNWFYKPAGGADWFPVDAALDGNPTYDLVTDTDLHQNGHSYKVVVSNDGGSVTSNTVILTVETGIDAPMITKQPLSATVDKGESVTFRLTATGTDLKYQWYYKTPTSDWFKCDAGVGADTDTYYLADPTNMNGYSYRCIITNDAGTAVSNTVTLTIRSAVNELKILTQPRSVVVSPGQTANFYVLAQGVGVIYQWYVRTPGSTWKVIDGAVSSGYGVVAEAGMGGTQYKVIVANAQGSITSDVVTLALAGASGAAPLITVYPKDVMVTIGKPATFHVEAVGDNLTYQWYYKASATAAWVKCSEAPATGDTYTLPATKANQNGYLYRCVISNSAGNTATPEVKLTVTSTDAAPQIVDQPRSTAVQAGQDAYFFVDAVGTDLKYQWYYRISSGAAWNKCDAATSTDPLYKLTTEARQNGFEYRCVVSNLAGSVTSDTVTLTVMGKYAAPVVTYHPEAQTVAEGDSAFFHVVASGADLKFQWQYRIGGGGDWYNCNAGTGATSDSYTITSVQKHQNGNEYRCAVSNKYGTVYSDTVKLTVVASDAKLPVIATQPMDQTVLEGDNAFFYVSAIGSGLTFQWYYRISSGAGWNKCNAGPSTNTYYQLTTEGRQNGYEYCCEVSNASGKVRSNVAKLNVVGKPVNVVGGLIKTQPASTSAKAGTAATFTVVGSKAGLTYQWYYRPAGTDTWYKCDAAKGDQAVYTLITDPDMHQNGHEYRCAVSDGKNTEYSQIVKLTVTKP